MPGNDFKHGQPPGLGSEYQLRYGSTFMKPRVEFHRLTCVCLRVKVFQGQLMYTTTCKSSNHIINEETNPFWTLPLSLTDDHNPVYSVVGRQQSYSMPTSDVSIRWMTNFTQLPDQKISLFLVVCLKKNKPMLSWTPQMFVAKKKAANKL